MMIFILQLFSVQLYFDQCLPLQYCPNPYAIAKLQHGGVVTFDPEGIEAHALRERHGLAMDQQTW